MATILHRKIPFSRMSHQLKFESHEVKAKDANIRNEDTFDIYDPRNPINERRRKSSKQKKGKGKG